MPIAIRVVSDEQYQAWRADAQAGLDGAYKNLMAAIGAASDTKLAAAGQ